MFDVSSLTQLVPLGGVTFLIIYLVGTLVADRAASRRERAQERGRWERERDELIEEHRKYVQHVTSDMKSQLQYQRERITQLEQELREVRQRGEL